MDYEGTRFADSAVELDGNRFVRCTFENATLIYGGGAVEITGCTFGGTIRWALSGALGGGLAALGKLFADHPEAGLRLVSSAMWPATAAPAAAAAE